MTESMREPVGSVAEEAARLFAVLQHRLGGPDASHEHGSTGTGSTGTGSTGPGQPGPDGTAGDPACPPECRVCPVCQALSAVRNVRPEVVEHLVAAAGSLTSALRAAFDGRHPQHHWAPDETADPAPSADPGPAGPARPPRVEHIEVR